MAFMGRLFHNLRVMVGKPFLRCKLGKTMSSKTAANCLDDLSWVCFSLWSFNFLICMLKGFYQMLHEVFLGLKVNVCSQDRTQLTWQGLGYGDKNTVKVSEENCMVTSMHPPSQIITPPLSEAPGSREEGRKKGDGTSGHVGHQPEWYSGQG